MGLFGSWFVVRVGGFWYAARAKFLSERIGAVGFLLLGILLVVAGLMF